MHKYFIEKPKYVRLKDQLNKYIGLRKKRIEKLYDNLGNVEISKEYINAFFDSFSVKSKRGDLLLTKESLRGIYEITRKYPDLSSKSISLIMGEYVKDLFDKLDPMSYFDNKSLKEKESSFENFIEILKKEGEKSDLEYYNESLKLDVLLPEYDDKYITYLKRLSIKYHKKYEDIIINIPESEIIQKDTDIFYEIAGEEELGFSGYPYSYKMTCNMILFNEIDWYKNKILFYQTKINGCSIKAPVTAELFLESIKKKKINADVDNKILKLN